LCPALCTANCFFDERLIRISYNQNRSADLFRSFRTGCPHRHTCPALIKAQRIMAAVNTPDGEVPQQNQEHALKLANTAFVVSPPLVCAMTTPKDEESTDTTVVPRLSKFFSDAAGVHPVGPICRAFDDGAVRRVAQAPTSGTGQFGREGVHRAPSKQAHLPAQVGRTRVERTGRQFKPSAELLKLGTSDGRVTWRLAQSCMWCSW
jgi:hypothetical protein